MAALLALVLTATPLSVLAGENTLLPGRADPFADVAPAAMNTARDAAARSSSVTMAVMLDPPTSTIGGEMRVDWRNPASEPLDEVWFRLFPNAFYYGEGGLTVSDLAVDGETVTGELALDATALRVPLPQPVAPGERADITLSFITTVPADSKGSYGIFTHDTGNGSWVLADWHPILAVWEDGGWALPAVTSFGDPTYAPAVFYEVQLAAPADLTVVTSGIAVAAQARDDGSVTRRYVAGPARDFALVADDDQTPRSITAGETEIRLWTAPGGDAATGEKTLDIAAAALRYYNETFGRYPAREVDLVETDPAGALGIAWAGLIFLDGPSLLGTYGEYDPEGLAAVVGHEVSHLWWGIQVGGDSNAHGFIQEGLATVSAILFLELYLGPEAAAVELDAWVIGPARDLLGEGDAIVDLPLAEGQDEGIRSDATYGKGSLGFFAIRQEIGAEAFAAGLREAASRYAWDEMTPAQLRDAFAAASGRNLDALWRHWFDEAAMTREEIDAIATSFGS